MNLLRVLATVSSLTLLSRITGFVRDVLIARIFGASMATDAFVVAFKLPNLLRRLFAEGAFSQAFVPVLAEYKVRNEHETVRELIDATASLLVVILAGTVLLGVIAAPLVVFLSAPGFHAEAEKFALTVHLLRICFPYIACISLVALASGILNTWSRFAVPAVTPTLLNLSFIVATLWLAPRLTQPIEALAIAVVCGGVLQLAFQLPFLWRLRLMPRPRWRPRNAGVLRILRLILPALLGVSVAQLSILLNNVFASFLAEGSVSWLYFADRLMEFPAGLLGAALGTILLPSLAKRHAEADSAEYSRLLDWGLRLTLLLALPAAVALAILAVPLLAVLFQYGEFSARDVLMTRPALVAYCVGLLPLIAVKVMAPGFYARQDVRTPVRIGVIALFATQLMNLLFVQWLQHAGLALSISVAAWINATLLWLGLRRAGAFQAQPGWPSFLLKILIAVLLMSAALVWAMGAEQTWLVVSAERVWRLALLVVLGGGSYLGLLWLLGFRPRDFSRRGAA